MSATVNIVTKTKGNARSSGYELAADSWYQEGIDVTQSLLAVEDFPGLIWDPACGEGNILRACQSRGLEAVGSDLVNRGLGGGVDFLLTAGGFTGSIICNPPYHLVEPFIHHALGMGAAKVAMLGRLALLEGQGRRETLWTTTPFAKVWVFSRRISIPPGGRGIKATGGSMAYGWFVWTKGHVGPATVGFLP
jgi:hypothetical protein